MIIMMTPITTHLVSPGIIMIIMMTPLTLSNLASLWSPWSHHSPLTWCHVTPDLSSTITRSLLGSLGSVRNQSGKFTESRPAHLSQVWPDSGSSIKWVHVAGGLEKQYRTRVSLSEKLFENYCKISRKPPKLNILDCMIDTSASLASLVLNT